MSPRRNRPGRGGRGARVPVGDRDDDPGERDRSRGRGPGGAAPFASSDQREEPGPDGSPWLVRPMTGLNSTKTYRCPGCDHEVRPGLPHVVAWPDGRVDLRRHWHSACWRARSARGPAPRRSPPPPGRRPGPGAGLGL